MHCNASSIIARAADFAGSRPVAAPSCMCPRPRSAKHDLSTVIVQNISKRTMQGWAQLHPRRASRSPSYSGTTPAGARAHRSLHSHCHVNTCMSDRAQLQNVLEALNSQGQFHASLVYINMSSAKKKVKVRAGPCLVMPGTGMQQICRVKSYMYSQETPSRGLARPCSHAAEKA